MMKYKLTLGKLGLTTGWLAENGGARAALDDGGSVGEDGAEESVGTSSMKRKEVRGKTGRGAMSRRDVQ